jgi:membrane protease YdiL (CAAX protease family)
VAAASSTLAFAVLHAYQGAVGIVRSGLLGFLFAAAFIMTGSLWPVILVHAGVDLLSGLVLGPRMLERNEKQV